MPTFGRAGEGKWHVVGPDGCRYGRAYADDPPEETVTATDIVAYDPPGTSGPDQPEPGTGLPRRRPRGRRDGQRLVLPAPVGESDAGLCTGCRSRLKTHQDRRTECITDLKRATPVRDVEWTRLEDDSLRACYWCRAHEPVLWASDALDSRVCPVCARLYDSPLGDPGPDDTPETDQRPTTPTGFVTPIVLGASLPDYDPTDLTGSNRPLVELRAKAKYAALELDLERTGHAFTPAALDALRAVRDGYAEAVADDDDHRTEVDLEVGSTARSATIEGVYPDDAVSVIEDCWEVVGDPDSWFRLGWPTRRRGYGPPIERSVPGDEPVGEAFPRLRTQFPDASVDTDALERVTDPGRFRRGERYYTDGAVTDIERVDDRVQATVRGSRPYDVRVTLQDGRFVEGRCSCPDDAVPCKHIVAAVLASVDVDPSGGAQSGDRGIEDVLAGAPREALVTLLLDAAADDNSLRRRIYEELGE